MARPRPSAFEIAEYLRPYAKGRSYKDGACIHGPDEPSHAFFWIETGAVRFNNVSRGGDHIEMFRLGPGDSFGEIALFSESAPPHFAYAVGDSELLRVSAASIGEAIENVPIVRDWMLRRFAVRLRNAYRMLDEVKRRKSADRVLRHIYWLANNGFQKDDGNGIEITQEELADRLGLSRASVTSALRKLKDAGLVTTGYRSIRLEQAPSHRRV